MRRILMTLTLIFSGAACSAPSSFSILQLDNQVFIELLDKSNIGQLAQSNQTARKTMLIDNSYVFQALPGADNSGKAIGSVADILFTPDQEHQWEMDEDLINQAKQKLTQVMPWYYWGSDSDYGNYLTCPTSICSEGETISDINQFRSYSRSQQIEIAKSNLSPSIGAMDGYKRSLSRNIREHKQFLDQNIINRLSAIGITKGVYEFKQNIPGNKQVVATIFYNNGKSFNPGPTIVDKNELVPTDLVVNYYPYYRDARIPSWVYSSPSFPYLSTKQGLIEIEGYKTIDTKVRSATYSGIPGPYDVYNGVNSPVPPEGISQSFSDQPLKCFIKKDPNKCSHINAPDLVSLIQNYEAETGNKAGKISINYYWPTFVTAGGEIDPRTHDDNENLIAPFPGYDIWIRSTSRSLTSVHTDHFVQPLEKYYVPPSTSCGGTPVTCTTSPGYWATRNAGPSYFLCAEEKNIFANNLTTGIGISTMKQSLAIDRIGNIVQAPVNSETKSACNGFGACAVSVNASGSYSERITSTQGAPAGSRDTWFANMIYSPLDDSYQGRAYKNSPLASWISDQSKASMLAKTSSNNRTYYEGIYDHIHDDAQITSDNHYLGQKLNRYQVPAITNIRSNGVTTHSYIIGEGSPPSADSLCSTIKPQSIGGGYAQ